MRAGRMADATTRFSSYAGDYDRVRPQPPALVAEVISQWAGVAAPEGIDMGTGTGLPAKWADIVTASQAMHWFDPELALPEIARLLRPGGVLAAYDCDWPPCGE